jgi:hypothetical protein
MAYTTPATWASAQVVTAADLNEQLRDNISFLKLNIALEAAAQLTISGGAITKTQGYHSVETEGGAATDDLETISGGAEGEIIIIRAHDASHVVTVKNTDNINIPGDLVLDSVNRFLMLMHDGTYWSPIMPAGPVFYSGVSGKLHYLDASTVKTVAHLTTTASDNLMVSNDTEQSTQETDYTKIKEIILNEALPDVRIKFDLKTSDVSGTATARIYKNGVALGTEQTDATGSYVTMSEDLTDFVQGDLIQIYAKISNATYAAYVENFRLYYDVAIVATALSSTNNDPA